MQRALYLGEGFWRSLAPAGKRFKATNRSGREPQAGRDYTIHVMTRVVHADGRTKRQQVVLYLA